MGSRDLAERLLVAIAPLREGTAADLAREAFDLAEALNTRAARLKPAPVPSLADAEWRDAPRAPYVPKVGDVVRIFGVTGLASPDWVGSVATVVPSSFGVGSVNLRIDYSPTVSWIQRYIDEGRSADKRELTVNGFHIRPATAAERVAAGLDAAPASKPVDREGLAEVLRRAWLDSPAGVPWFDVADAAIAYMNGGAS